MSVTISEHTGRNYGQAAPAGGRGFTSEMYSMLGA